MLLNLDYFGMKIYSPKQSDGCKNIQISGHTVFTFWELNFPNEYLFLLPQFCEADGRRIHWTRIWLSIFLILSRNQRKFSVKSLRSGDWQFFLAVQKQNFKINLTPQLLTSMLLNKLFIWPKYIKQKSDRWLATFPLLLN